MRHHMFLSGAFAAALALAAPQAAQAGETESYYSPEIDAFGYYIPNSIVQSGPWRLNHIFIGSPQDMADYEAGETEPTFGPVMVHFDNVESDTGVNEMGETYYTETIRAVPHFFMVTPHEVRIEHYHAALGMITLVATLHMDAVGEPAGEEAPPALTGGMEVGEEIIRNLSFQWWGGD